VLIVAALLTLVTTVPAHAQTTELETWNIYEGQSEGSKVVIWEFKSGAIVVWIDGVGENKKMNATASDFEGDGQWDFIMACLVGKNQCMSTAMIDKNRGINSPINEVDRLQVDESNIKDTTLNLPSRLDRVLAEIKKPSNLKYPW
jgi:hypothetical protein